MATRNHTPAARPCAPDAAPCAADSGTDAMGCGADSERIAACEAAACGCRPMVQRAYRELVERGQPNDHALDAAVVVLRWHHPEVPGPEAGEIVSRWVSDGHVH